MSDHTDESDLIRQRRENFDELVRLGVDPYPRAFERTDTVQALVSAHGHRKADVLVISDGHARIQAYIRQDSLPERDFKIFRLLDFGDFIGVEGNLFRT